MEETKKFFTLVTYNLDCSSNYQEQRLNVFVEQMKKSAPDIIVIQEGTREIYSKLFLVMQHMGYKRKFFPEIQKRACGEVIFSLLPIKSGEYIPFQYTKQGRGISLYLVEVNGQDLWIGGTQLESGSKRSPLVRKQISQIQKRFSKVSETVILAGDFQIANYQNDIKEPDGWVDAWYEAGKSGEKFTVDSKINTMAEVQDRPDRVWLLQSRDSAAVPIEYDECRLIGLPEPYKEMFFASKHFGVWVRFALG